MQNAQGGNSLTPHVQLGGRCMVSVESWLGHSTDSTNRHATNGPATKIVGDIGGSGTT